MVTRIAVAVALLVAPALAHADVYQYVTEGGVVSFTDDPERIPAKYIEQVTQRPDQRLEDYARTTVSEHGASIESFKTSIDLEALEREQQALTVARGETMARGEPARVKIQIDDSVALSVDPNSDEPIYVDRKRYMTRHGITTPHTVVSRGGKPLIVISDRPR